MTHEIKYNRSVTRSGPAIILVVSNVKSPVKGVFYSPMASFCRQDLLGGCMRNAENEVVYGSLRLIRANFLLR